MGVSGVYSYLWLGYRLVGWLREVGEIVRSIGVKITQTTNPIANMTKTIGLFLNYLPIAIFLSNNHPDS